MKQTRIFSILSLMLVAAFGVWLMAFAAEPDWIQYNERVVGENSPLYTDVVNRPAKQLWANFTSEHYTDGSHKPIDVLDSPYTLDTLRFRDNSGIFEMSDDSGATWSSVSSSGAVTRTVLTPTIDITVTSEQCHNTVIVVDNQPLTITLPLTTSCNVGDEILIFDNWVGIEIVSTGEMFLGLGADYPDRITDKESPASQYIKLMKIFDGVWGVIGHSGVWNDYLPGGA